MLALYVPFIFFPPLLLGRHNLMFLGSREDDSFWIVTFSHIKGRQDSSFLRIIVPCASWRTPLLNSSLEDNEKDLPSSSGEPNAAIQSLREGVCGGGILPTKSSLES